MRKAIVCALAIGFLVLVLSTASFATVLDFFGFETGETLSHHIGGTYQCECTGYGSPPGTDIYPMIHYGIKHTGDLALNVRCWGASASCIFLAKERFVDIYYEEPTETEKPIYGNYDASTLYARFYFRYEDGPDGDETEEPIFAVFSQYFEQQGEDEYLMQPIKFELRIEKADSYDYLKAYNASGCLGTYGTPLVKGVWYCIETKIGTGSTAAYEVKVDSASAISGTADLGTHNSAYILIGKWDNYDNQDVDFYYDDVCLDNAEYPGYGQAILLKPNADGTDNQWLPTYCTKWNLIDDIPHGYAGFGDDCIYTGGYPNLANTSELEDFSLGSGSVEAVKEFASCASYNWGYTVGFKYRIRSSHFQNDLYEWSNEGSAFSLYSLGYRVLDDGYTWTQADVNSLEAGLFSYSSPKCNALGAMIEYKNGGDPVDLSDTMAKDFYPDEVYWQQIDCEYYNYHVWDTSPYSGEQGSVNVGTACASPNTSWEYSWSRPNSSAKWDSPNSQQVSAWALDTNYKAINWFKISGIVGYNADQVPPDAIVTGCTIMVEGYGEQAYFGNERSDYDICVYDGPTGGNMCGLNVDDTWVCDIDTLDEIMDGSGDVYVGVNGPIGYHDDYVDQYSHVLTDYVCLRVTYYIPEEPEEISGVSLSTNLASPQYAYTGITLIATPTDGIDPEYRFEVYDSTPSLVAYRDYASSNTWLWTPTVAGTYTLKVIAREYGTQSPTYDDEITNYVILAPSTPTITIDTPTLDSTYQTSLTSIPLGGTASVANGLTFSSVTWANNRGGSGNCTGTTSWNVDSITLQSGENVITVTVTDSLSQQSQDVLTVTCSSLGSSSVVDFTGFELGYALQGETSGGEPLPMVESYIKRSGNCAMEFGVWNGDNANPDVNGQYSYFTMGTEYDEPTTYTRFYFMYDELPNEQYDESVGFFSAHSYEFVQVDPEHEYEYFIRKLRLKLGLDGCISAYDKNDSLLGTPGSQPLSPNEWYRIEVRVGTGTSANWEWRLYEEGSSTPLEIKAGTGDLYTENADYYQFGKDNDQSYRVQPRGRLHCYYDDVVIEDGNWPGPGQIFMHVPVDDGTDNGFSASSGDKWACIDDAPAGLSTSPDLPNYSGYDYDDYIYTTSSSSPYTAEVQKPMEFLVPFTTPVGAVKLYSMYSGPATTRIRSGASYAEGVSLMNVDPTDSQPWTISKINNLQIGLRNTSEGYQTQCTLLAAMVDYRNPTICEPIDYPAGELIYPVSAWGSSSTHSTRKYSWVQDNEDHYEWPTFSGLLTYGNGISQAGLNKVKESDGYHIPLEESYMLFDGWTPPGCSNEANEAYCQVFRFDVTDIVDDIEDMCIVADGWGAGYYLSYHNDGFELSLWDGSEWSDPALKAHSQYDIDQTLLYPVSNDYILYDTNDEKYYVYALVVAGYAEPDSYSWHSTDRVDYMALRVKCKEDLSDVSLYTNLASPQYGYTDITFMAIPTGGVSPEYRFEVYDSTPSLVASRDYDSLNYWNWTPTATGTYSLKVIVRESGTSSPTYDDEITNYVIQTPPNPTVTITSPTSNPTYETISDTLSIGGTASAYGSLTVSSVSWSNNRGGSGSCTGTTSWSASGITLQSGENVITVTATDSLSHQGTDVLTVTYTPSNPVTYISSSSAAFYGDGDYVPSYLTANKPANIQAGDLLIGVTSGSGTPQTPSGWTQVESQNTMGVFYKYATGSEPSTYTFSWSGETKHLGILAYRYTATSSPIDCDDYNTGLTTDSLNMSQAGLLIAAFIYPTSNPSGMTQRLSITSVWEDNNDEEQSSTVKIYDEVRTSGGWTGTRSAGTNQYAWSYILAIKGQ